MHVLHNKLSTRATPNLDLGCIDARQFRGPKMAGKPDCQYHAPKLVLTTTMMVKKKKMVIVTMMMTRKNLELAMTRHPCYQVNEIPLSQKQKLGKQVQTHR
jgi:hypothetical protein